MNEPSITIRASAWGGLFDCAYRFEGIHLLGMRNIVGLRAALGTAIHAGTAAFDQSRIDGRGVTVDDAAGVLVDKLRDPETSSTRTGTISACRRQNALASRCW